MFWIYQITLNNYKIAYLHSLITFLHDMDKIAQHNML
jgi:hypothetical protein